MGKKKDFVESVDYVITIRKRKKFIRNPKKNICPICENCNHKSLCLNRKNKETMERCSKCKNCNDYENCDNFHFYNEYEGRLLKLGINANTGKAIRQSFFGKSEEIVLDKLRNQFIKNNVTRTEIERFLQSEKHKSNSSISKEYSIIKNAFISTIIRSLKSTGVKVKDSKIKKSICTKISD